MTFEPPKGKGRCEQCGWFVRLQGHHAGCTRGRCRRCDRFTKLPGRQLCMWCAATDDDARREIRRQAVADRLAELDGDR
ncbi:hypothetical protein B8W69_26985 [Mycobacterium vulneris]|uniref:Uncharacterized protein n=1 Tax=Mycolicibacterium vulneris TaxID=547163 RepID=A0A1X2KK65_9MYCO|nr:hypothetical protein [Mycolicibacterium vulneris]OSC22101.1 hypothetical protein B8W69_26985 [Mycolicibacterium vulneris]